MCFLIKIPHKTCEIFQTKNIRNWDPPSTVRRRENKSRFSQKNSKGKKDKDATQNNKINEDREV